MMRKNLMETVVPIPEEKGDYTIEGVNFVE